ncbi:MAG: bile acid:sodium symporter [Cyclobacteriaceae bacterium]|nr:bile acid:sodium symporter [Cyclobacteriaceae bacterium]
MNANRSRPYLNIKNILLKIGLDGFLIALLLSVLIAYLWPEPGLSRSRFSLAWFADIGVSVIFFFYGLRLSLQTLKADLYNWKLHLSIQSTTFIVFPLLLLLVWQFFPSQKSSLLWLGAFYLATLPSTVSSSVVMVSIAGGNISSAIFNASVSSLIGVFITPVWMGLFLTSTTSSYDLLPVITKLIFQVLLPVVAGIMLHNKFGAIALRYRPQLKNFDQLVILLIIYTSFSDSFYKELFSGFGVKTMSILFTSMAFLFFAVYAYMLAISHWMHFSRADRITAVFCGSKKSLVHGTVMSKVLFPGAEMVGVIILPLMIFHALQLIIVSIIAQREARKNALKND